MNFQTASCYSIEFLTWIQTLVDSHWLETKDSHWMENKESHWLIRIKLLKKIKTVFVLFVSVVGAITSYIIVMNGVCLG